MKLNNFVKTISNSEMLNVEINVEWLLRLLQLFGILNKGEMQISNVINVFN